MEAEPGGFYLSPPQVDGIIAALERFVARMNKIIESNENGPGETSRLEEKGEMCS